MLHGGICAENKAGSRRGRCYEDAFELKEKQAKSAGIRAFKVFGVFFLSFIYNLLPVQPNTILLLKLCFEAMLQLWFYI